MCFNSLSVKVVGESEVVVERLRVHVALANLEQKLSVEPKIRLIPKHNR